jgi:GNAT superfamily N-acetyltransferase
MEIKLYEDWMKPQVNKLFSMQYDRPEEEVAVTMDNFYEHPFQKDKCIRLVSMDGDIVTGFQSLFYWPYEKNGQVYHSFQSGNSLVHPDYRGKGIFGKLLNYLDEYNKDLNIDFLMGFPVQMSYGSFMKNKWANPLNIVWYVKLLNPFAFLFSIDGITSKFDQQLKPVEQKIPANSYRLAKDAAFENWINASRDQQPYCFFHYNEGENAISFSLKTNQRNRWFNELIIGDIRTNSSDEAFIKKAFSKLSRKAFATLRVTALTIALNEDASVPVFSVIKSLGYAGTKKSIYFITKSYGRNKDIEDKQNWVLYRSDVDTW